MAKWERLAPPSPCPIAVTHDWFDAYTGYEQEVPVYSKCPHCGANWTIVVFSEEDNDRR